MSGRDYPITIFYSEEDGGFVAIVPDLKGCTAFGESPQEALRELETPMDLWLEVARPGLCSNSAPHADQRLNVDISKPPREVSEQSEVSPAALQGNLP